MNIHHKDQNKLRQFLFHDTSCPQSNKTRKLVELGRICLPVLVSKYLVAKVQISEVLGCLEGGLREWW